MGEVVEEESQGRKNREDLLKSVEIWIEKL